MSGTRGSIIRSSTLRSTIRSPPRNARVELLEVIGPRGTRSQGNFRTHTLGAPPLGWQSYFVWLFRALAVPRVYPGGSSPQGHRRGADLRCAPLSATHPLPAWRLLGRSFPCRVFVFLKGGACGGRSWLLYYYTTILLLPYYYTTINYTNTTDLTTIRPRFLVSGVHLPHGT